MEVVKKSFCANYKQKYLWEGGGGGGGGGGEISRLYIVKHDSFIKFDGLLIAFFLCI